MYDEITKLISNLGFPIGVCIYLLVRFEKKIEVLNKSIQDLTRVITTVMDNQKRWEDRLSSFLNLLILIIHLSKNL